ncbi:ABC transporter ATP-binding protein [Thalassospira sp. SM2505]|uniref:Spermidine/putrescine ABC transporter ATP-binding protein n=1 Tax=Thalassospira profundimaris TaxID=502049 RepID=A0A367WX51_9PROT|nr:ABC transporter ATP-binding protein [Thalassospira profundimaris]RCK45012.1 spermidine/putrescine ABC transporter ATP-binding protein [Thalassospira profundimaris]
MTAPVSIRNATKTFGDFTALDDVSLDIAAGEFIVLLGPSGCGKTTLLSLLGGFLSPTKGVIEIAGRDMGDVPPARRPTTTMFQDYALFPHMTLRDNVAFGLKMRNVAKRERQTKAEELLDMVGLKASAGKKPHELSGGQRQRVALARALAVEPDVLLLDEPLGALDLKLRRQMQDELKAIQKRVGTTFVHVTHDQEEAMAIADRIVVMNAGKIEDVGRPEDIYMRPRTLFSARFMGEVNFIPGTLEALSNESISVKTVLGAVTLPNAALGDQALKPGQKITLAIRPEHFRASTGTGPRITLGKAKVEDGSFFGTHHRAHLSPLDYPDMVITAHMPQSAIIEPGAWVDLTIDPASVVILPGHPAATAQEDAA